MVPTRVTRVANEAASHGDVDRIGRMASGYANTSLSGRQFNGEATGSGHASPGQWIQWTEQREEGQRS